MLGAFRRKISMFGIIVPVSAQDTGTVTVIKSWGVAQQSLDCCQKKGP